jgi:hypothetical protein
LTEGANTITVNVTDAEGNTATKTITVNATTTGNYIKATVSPETGPPPLEITLRISGSVIIANPKIIASGPNQIEELESTFTGEYRYRMTVEGLYFFTVQGTGQDGTFYQDTVSVEVSSLAKLDTMLRAKWAALTTALMNKDIATALTIMHPVSRERYQIMFNLLKDQLPTIVASHTGIVLVSIINENRVWYDLETSESGGQFTYRIVFVKDTNGSWYILEF